MRIFTQGQENQKIARRHTVVCRTGNFADLSAFGGLTRRLRKKAISECKLVVDSEYSLQHRSCNGPGLIGNCITKLLFPPGIDISKFQSGSHLGA